jgi:hypothetical protein
MEKNHLEDVEIQEMTILKWIIKRWNRRNRLTRLFKDRSPWSCLMTTIMGRQVP